MDSVASGEGSLVIRVSQEDFGKIITSESNTVSADISSKKQVERLGFKYFSLIIAVLFFAFILITCACIKEKSTVDVKSASVGEMFKALIQNDQAMAMVIAIVLVNSAVYITSNLLIYFFKYDLGGANWEGNYTLFSTFGGGMQILAMMLIFPLLRKFFNTIKIFYICIISAISGYFILLFIALSGNSQVLPFFVPGFFIFSAVGILNVIVTVFLANTVDYGELMNKRRDESVIFSMQTFVVKLASGVAALVASVCLSVFNISESSNIIEAVDGSYIKGLSNTLATIKSNGASLVSGSSVFGLRLTMTIIPVVFLFLAVLIFKKKYILTDEKLREITDELKSRRA
ncbi:MAG: MFS transporter [Agathobacter sp.]|nr:MFS transporter [Agathobacter sp.]